MVIPPIAPIYTVNPPTILPPLHTSPCPSPSMRARCHTSVNLALTHHNSAPVFSFPLPEDGIAPGSPTRPNAPTTPAKDVKVVRRSSDSDIGTPPKGKTLVFCYYNKHMLNVFRKFGIYLICHEQTNCIIL